MAGRWSMAAVQTSFAVMPALVYLFAGLSPQTRLDRHRRRLHDAADPAAVPGQLAARRRRRGASRRMALFDRIFEYLDMHVDIEAGTDRAALPARRGRASRTSGSATATTQWTLRGIDLDVAPGTKIAIVGETGSGKTTLGYLAARLYDPERGAVRLDGTDIRDATFASLADAVGVVSQETYLFHASVRENLRFAKPRRDRRGGRGGRPRRPGPRDDRRRCPTATTPSSASAASASPAARSSASPSPARSCATRRSSSSTRRRARSTSRPSAPSRRRCASWPPGARRSSSRTASRPSATPTRSSSSTAASSSSAAPTTSCSPLGGRYAALVARDGGVASGSPPCGLTG